MRWYENPISGSFPYAAKRVRTRFTSDSARHPPHVPPRDPLPSPTASVPVSPIAREDADADELWSSLGSARGSLVP